MLTAIRLLLTFVMSLYLLLRSEWMNWHNATMCFFFNDTATTEIYTLSLHDTLPILRCEELARCRELSSAG